MNAHRDFDGGCVYRVRHPKVTRNYDSCCSRYCCDDAAADLCPRRICAVHYSPSDGDADGVADEVCWAIRRLSVEENDSWVGARDSLSSQVDVACVQRIRGH